MVADRDPVGGAAGCCLPRCCVWGARPARWAGMSAAGGDSGGASSGERSATGRAVVPGRGRRRVRGGRREGVTHLARRRVAVPDRGAGRPRRPGRRRGSSPRRSGPTRSTRCRTATTSPVPNGARHVAACSSTLPSANTSEAGSPGPFEELFGGEVAGRADQAAAAGQRGRRGGPRDAGVDDPWAGRRDQDVARPEVAVHRARAVDRLERLGQLDPQPPHRRPPTAGRSGRGPRRARAPARTPWPATARRRRRRRRAPRPPAGCGPAETTSTSSRRQARNRGSAANSRRITRTATRAPFSVRARWTLAETGPSRARSAACRGPRSAGCMSGSTPGSATSRFRRRQDARGRSARQPSGGVGRPPGRGSTRSGVGAGAQVERNATRTRRSAASRPGAQLALLRPACRARTRGPQAVRGARSRAGSRRSRRRGRRRRRARRPA